MNTYSYLCPGLWISPNLITVNIVELLILVVQVPSCGLLVFVNYINCDLSHEYKGTYWFTPITDAIMKWYKIMNNEMVTYTIVKNNVTWNWELTFISLKLTSALHWNLLSGKIGLGWNYKITKYDLPPIIRDNHRQWHILWCLSFFSFTSLFGQYCTLD